MPKRLERGSEGLPQQVQKEGFPMSTVDKKLMDQMLRFAKDVVVEGVDDMRGGDSSRALNSRDVHVMRAIMERGMRTLPIEQRVLSEAAFDKRAFDLGRMYVIRQLGIWEVMSYDVLHHESEYVAFPELIDGLVDEGLVRRVSDSSEGEQRDVLMLTDAGKELFAQQEDRLNEHAGEMFERLTEGEKMQLYLLLRKMMGTPASESNANQVHYKTDIA